MGYSGEDWNIKLDNSLDFSIGVFDLSKTLILSKNVSLSEFAIKDKVTSFVDVILNSTFSKV